MKVNKIYSIDERFMQDIQGLIKKHYSSPQEAIPNLLRITAFFTQFYAVEDCGEKLTAAASRSFKYYLQSYENIVKTDQA